MTASETELVSIDQQAKLEKEYELLQRDYSTLKGESEAVQNKNEALFTENVELKLKHEQKATKIIEYEVELAYLREQVKVFEEEREDIRELQEELEEERESLEEFQQSLSLKEAYTAMGEAERLKHRVELLTEHLRKVEQERIEQAKRVDEAEDAIYVRDFLTNQLKEEREIIRKYRQAEIQWERVETLREDYEVSRQEATYLKEEKQTIQAELKSLREEVTNLRQDEERVITAEHRSSFYEIRTRTLEREIQRLRKKEEDNISDESRVFESFQVLIEQHQKTADSLQVYPGDDEMAKRILDVAKQGNFEFSTDMVQGFLAAMRSTRFIILKGLSGTGKTSLPKIFAQALGGVCETIAVQPSWKSKTDLVGFYNHFNDRFMATQFTEELFKAQLPANRNKFYFIVLDEMNLARVEYYFSDFNSKLELERSKQVIELFDTIGRTTGTLSDYIIDGNKLRIPPNVFFIGTINEDDSTYTLSDKIYDRAQVLDFQSALSNRVGNMEKIEIQQPVSFSDFETQNEKISTIDVSRQMKSIEEIMMILKEQLFIELGNRPRRHMRSFIQAYVASNWPDSHAIDLQIVSKVVPKIIPGYHEEFFTAMDLLINTAEHNRKGSITATAIERVKRNAR